VRLVCDDDPSFIVLTETKFMFGAGPEILFGFLIRISIVDEFVRCLLPNTCLRKIFFNLISIYCSRALRPIFESFPMTETELNFIF